MTYNKAEVQHFLYSDAWQTYLKSNMSIEAHETYIKTCEEIKELP